LPLILQLNRPLFIKFTKCSPDFIKLFILKSTVLPGCPSGCRYKAIGNSLTYTDFYGHWAKSMKDRLLKFLDIEPDEAGRVGLLFVMGIFMALFIATTSVASQTLYLQHFSEQKDLPYALFWSGVYGLIATVVYNFLQNRIFYGPIQGNASPAAFLDAIFFFNTIPAV